jgi:hypothetical protein
MVRLFPFNRMILFEGREHYIPCAIRQDASSGMGYPSSEEIGRFYTPCPDIPFRGEMVRQRSRRYWLFLVVLLLIGMTVPAVAQNDVVVSPASLNVAGIKGDGSVNRTLTISVAENVTVTSIVSNELVREDNAFTIPPEAINATVPSDALGKEGTGIGNAPVSIDLRGIHSGKFTGNLYVSYRSADEKQENLPVPMTVTVKDRPLLPLLVLLLGVGIGLGIFSYTAKGKRRDTLLQRYGHLKKETINDNEFKNLDPSLYFQAVITSKLDAASLLIRTSSFDKAEELINGAYDTWQDWLKDKNTVIRLLEKSTALRQALKRQGDELKSHGEFEYIHLIEQNLATLSDQLIRPSTTTADFETAMSTFSDGLVKEQTSLDQFRRYRVQMEALEKRGADRMMMEGFWTRLKVLTPGDAMTQKFESDLRQASGMGAHPIDLPLLEEPQPPGEGAKPAGWWDQWKKGLALGFSWAEVRLGIYGAVSFLLLLIILLIVGYQQLYLANPTFGAGTADYFALFLWGLGVGPGSEATVKSVREQFTV